MIELITKIYDTFEAKKDLFTQYGFKPVATIDLYRGQPLNPEQFEYYDLPAIFIDRKVKWTKTGQTYEGAVELDFHIVLDPTWDTSNISTSYLDGLGILVQEAMIRSVLDNLSTPVTSKLLRDDENPVETGVVNYNLMRYKCTYYDPFIVGTEYIEAIIEKLVLAGKLVKSL